MVGEVEHHSPRLELFGRAEQREVVGFEVDPCAAAAVEEVVVGRCLGGDDLVALQGGLRVVLQQGDDGLDGRRHLVGRRCHEVLERGDTGLWVLVDVECVVGRDERVAGRRG